MRWPVWRQKIGMRTAFVARGPRASGCLAPPQSPEGTMATPSARVLERDLKISPPKDETRIPHHWHHRFVSPWPRNEVCAFRADKGQSQRPMTWPCTPSNPSTHLDFSHIARSYLNRPSLPTTPTLSPQWLEQTRPVSCYDQGQADRQTPATRLTMSVSGPWTTTTAVAGGVSL